MSDEPRHELDADALAMLDAFRAEEQLPPMVHDRVWDRVTAGVEHERRARWLRRGVGLGVLAAAAVALLWVGGRAALSSSQTHEPPSQAGYEKVDEGAPEGRAEALGPDRRAPDRRIPDDQAEPQPQPESSSVRPPVAPQTSDPSPHGEPADAPSPRARRDQPTTSDGSSRRDRPPSEPTTPGDDLAEENRLLGLARRALIDEQPERALARLAEHERRFPQGVLTEERQALRAVALCEADRPTEGRAAARVFLREHPQAALAQRVRSACLD